MMRTKAWQRGFATIVALVAWGALILQYVLIIDKKAPVIGAAQTSLEYFSYFTILSNILVAITTTVAAFDSTRSWFAQARVRAAIALYIAVTGCIYLFVLSALWAPQGLQWLADVSLHYATPALYLLWWITACVHGRLLWSDALRWLLFPLGFLIWVFIRGAWQHVYPYPFVDVDALGLATVLRNCVGVFALFVVLGLALVGIDRLLGRATNEPG